MVQRGEVAPKDRARLAAARRKLERAEQELRSAVVHANCGGGSIRMIAGELGVSPSTVHKWIGQAQAAEPERH